MFIAVDGIDGAGKTTLVRQLADVLGPCDPVVTKEPTGNSDWGKKMRVAAAEGRLDRESELENFQKDRLHHIETVIQPAIEDDRIVISDRYVDSTLAYQANSPKEADALYERLKEEIVVPDVTFILVCPVEVGLERIRKRNGKPFSHFESQEFLRKAAAIYESRRGQNYEIIDASGEAEDTFHQAVALLAKRFSNVPQIVDAVRRPLPKNLHLSSHVSYE